MKPEEARGLLNGVILRAFAEGKTIQERLRGKSGEVWLDLRELDSFKLIHHPELFRVKPEPREWWLNVYGHGQVHHCYMCKSKAEADLAASLNRTECLHVLEVLP